VGSEGGQSRPRRGGSEGVYGGGQRGLPGAVPVKQQSTLEGGGGRGPEGVHRGDQRGCTEGVRGGAPIIVIGALR
jgi:hypothetical protein